MSITINGSGTITGISAGGLPDGSVTAADLASSLDLSGKTITNMNPSGVYLGGTGSANYLDDYETGTFTFSVVPANGSYSYTYGQTGYYTKIGNLVQVSMWIHLTIASAVSGGVTINGMPFTISSTVPRQRSVFSGYNHVGVSGQGTGVVLGTAGAAYLQVGYVDTSFGTFTLADSSNLGTGTELYINFTYQI